MIRLSVFLRVIAASLVVSGCVGSATPSTVLETLPPAQPTATRMPPALTAIPRSTITPPVPSVTSTPTTLSTATPASTASLALTLTPAMPAADSDAYHLKPWRTRDDQERLAQMQAFASWTAEFHPGYHDALAHGAERYMAVAELEAWMHQIDTSHEDMLWDAIGHLARAGDQLATDLMARRIAQALNDDRVSLEDLPTWSRLEQLDDGEPASLQHVPALFGDGRDGWVLTVGQAHGAVLSIEKDATDNWNVAVIASAWESAHESGLYVTVYAPPDGGTPEIWVAHMIQAGGGPTFAQYETHVYAWRRDQWIDLSGGGFLTSGAESWSAPVPLEPGERSAFELHTLLDPFQYPMCEWKIAYRFARLSDRYEYRRAVVAVPMEWSGPNELLCMSKAWDWAVTNHQYESLVIWMEEAWAHWPAPDTDLGIPLGTVREAFGSDFPALFDFQLGRFEALSGRLAQAETRLADLVAQPSDPDHVQAQRLAAHFLAALPDIAAAEAAVAPDLQVGQGVPWSPLPFQSTATARSDWALRLQEIERLLYLDQQPKRALERLAAFEPTCVDANSREPYDCARPLYLRGLALEQIDDADAAVAVYWRLWLTYPDSPYAVLARLKLMEAVNADGP